MHYSAGTIAPYQRLIALLFALVPMLAAGQSSGPDAGRLTVVNLLTSAIDVEVGTDSPLRLAAGASTGYLDRSFSNSDVQAFAPGAPVASGAMAVASGRDVTAAVVDIGSGPEWFFSEDHGYPLTSFSLQWMHLASDPAAQQVQVRFGCNGDQWDEGLARFATGSTLDANLPIALVRGPDQASAGSCQFSIHRPDGTQLAALPLDARDAHGHALRAFLVDQPGGVALISMLQEVRPTSEESSLAQMQPGLYLTEPSLAGVGVAIYGSDGSAGPSGMTFDFDENGQPVWSALDGLIDDGAATDLATQVASSRDASGFSTQTTGSLDLHYRTCELEISSIDGPFRGQPAGAVLRFRPLVCEGPQ